jgi:hypothetical protein
LLSDEEIAKRSSLPAPGEGGRAAPVSAAEVPLQKRQGKSSKEGMMRSRCRATIVFGDDFGDNSTTFHCQLIKGHDGPHQESGDMGYGVVPLPYTLTWTGDARAKSSKPSLARRQNGKA